MIEKALYFGELSDYAQMRLAINKQPDVPLPDNATIHQKFWFLTINQHWTRIGRYIDYLHLIQRGYTDAEPPDSYSDSYEKKRIEAWGNHYFSILQCLISGWHHLNTLDFKNARELFGEICRSEASTHFRICLQSSNIKRTKIDNVKRWEIKRTAFMRMGADGKVDFLHPSDKLWLVPLQNFYKPRGKTPFDFCWKNLIVSHREFVNVEYRIPMEDNYRTIYKWDDGIPICPKTGRIPDFIYYGEPISKAVEEFLDIDLNYIRNLSR